MARVSVTSRFLPPGGMPRAYAHAIALLVILVVCGGLWSRTPVAPFGEFDQPFYLGIAHDIRTLGRFTDGYVFADPAKAEHPAGMRFAPLYPGLLAGAMTLDPAFARGADCLVATGKLDDTTCPRDACLVRGIQFAMLAGVMLLIFSLARYLLGGTRPGAIALALALITVPMLLRYVNYTMTELTTLALLSGGLSALAVTARTRSMQWALAAGILFGLTALTRPACLYGFLAIALGGIVLARTRTTSIPSGRIAAAFVAGGLVCLAPWVARNAIVLGHPALTRGYDSHTLVQRIAYDQMTWGQLGQSIVCWLPDGKGLGERVFGKDACEPFGWETAAQSGPTASFYTIGNGSLMTETVKAAGGWDAHLSYLVRNYLVTQPIKHAVVTLSMALRGAWISQWWGFLLGLVCMARTWQAVRRGDTAFLAITLPCWFMLLFHAAVAVNQPRYNLFLILPYAICGADFIESFLRTRHSFGDRLPR